MNLLQQLFDKPWEPAGGAAALRDRPSVRAPAETVALRFFLGVVTVIFSLLIAAYAVRMALEDWRPIPEPRLLWVNTVFLFAASIALHVAWRSARDGVERRVRPALLAAGAGALAFLVGQIVAWRQLDAMPVFDVTNPSIAFFYLITGLHALHILGGLVGWARVTRRAGHAPVAPRTVAGLRLCATYWHFLLGVWLVLFGLLFSGDENLEIILTICGIR